MASSHIFFLGFLIISIFSTSYAMSIWVAFCKANILFTPYVRVYQKGRSGTLLIDRGPGFINLNGMQDIYICTNGLEMGEVFEQGELHWTPHHCELYNPSVNEGVPGDHPKKMLKSILLIGHPKDLRLPALQIFVAPMFDRIHGDYVNMTSLIMMGTEGEQHHPGGNGEIRELIKSHLPFPNEYNSTEAFPYMLYMSEVIQSVSQQTQTQVYRRWVDKLDENGQGHNMGVMYWQLNDIWEGCSWASIEVSGRWKLQIYYAKKFLAPILASPRKEENGDVVVELLSDLKDESVVGNVILKVFRFGGVQGQDEMTPVYQTEVQASAEFLKAPEVIRVEKKILEQVGCAGEKDSGTENPCIVYVTYDDTPDNFLWLQYPTNKRALADPRLKISNVTGLSNGKDVTFKLTGESIAPFVYLTVKDDHYGYFQDNGFVMVENEKVLTYHSEDGISPEEFIKRIEVMSLFNTTKV